jgi:predicted aminopeptidase
MRLYGKEQWQTMGNGNVVLVSLLGFFLCSCSTIRFYSQALAGQAEVMRKARPVAQVLESPSTQPLLRQKLSTVADMLSFAETEMHRPARGQYDHYADLGRRHLVWVVFAAPEFSVIPKHWSYPLLGQLAYRGYFKPALAQQEADQLKAQGDDVHVAGVDAYSTLGYLRDPLLNTFIGRDDADLAELICHELTHQRLYFKGDTEFNEALATAVGQEGARRWLRARGRRQEGTQYEQDLRAERAFIALALATREELKKTYTLPDRTRAERLQQKNAVLQRFKSRALALDQRGQGSNSIARWFQKPVNNARLATLSTYHERVPAFESMLRRADGHLETFFAEVESMRKLTREERDKRVFACSNP